MIRIDTRRGLDIGLGPPPNATLSLLPSRVALLGSDYPGLRPHLTVEVGDSVTRGDVLFTDRAYSEICYVAPASGLISSIQRGARRSLEALVIELESPEHDATDLPGISSDSSVETIRKTLQRTGFWSAFRSRPYDQVPQPSVRPAQLFVTAIDTNPLAPDPAPLIRAHAEAFEHGLCLLASLSDETFLCMAADASLPCPDVEGLTPVAFSGPHPAGLPGTHIYQIAHHRGELPPAGVIWHIGYQDVIAIGKLFLSGRLDTARTISVAGPATDRPSLISTLMGAEVGALVGPFAEKDARVISGSVLSGRLTTPGTGYLGRYHNQIVLLPPSQGASATSSGMLAVEAFDRIWPFAVPPAPLLRALLIEDTETVSGLGYTLLAEEDLALCSYVCPAHLDYGRALRRTLDEIKQGR